MEIGNKPSNILNNRATFDNNTVHEDPSSYSDNQATSNHIESNGSNNYHTYGNCYNDNEIDTNQTIQTHNSKEDNDNLDGPELLPLCDLLFNIISLAAYFCNVVFDSATAYNLYLLNDTLWFVLTLTCIIFSSIAAQILSLRWYLKRACQDQPTVIAHPYHLCVISTHFLQAGVLWRYFKLFVPVNLKIIKYEVRDLCMLRMVHAFAEASPMLLMQVYLLFSKKSSREITDLNIISISLSMFNLCWAVASFSKNLRKENMYKLVLTWLGVIFQFFWRLGTISARIFALSVFSIIYRSWILIVVALHWFAMLLFILSSKGYFNGSKYNACTRVFYSSLVAWVYVFGFVNLNEGNSHQSITIYYCAIFVENLILWLSSIGFSSNYWFSNLATLSITIGFALGLMFMIVYYQFFHIRHLKHTFLPYNLDNNHQCPELNNRLQDDMYAGFKQGNDDVKAPVKIQMNSLNHQNNCVLHNIPGVFNCRLNPALKRKKKKPTSFVPPPAAFPLARPNLYNQGKKVFSPNDLFDRNFTKSENTTSSDPNLTLKKSVVGYNISDTIKKITPELPKATQSNSSSSPVTSYTTNMNINNCNDQKESNTQSDYEGSASSKVNIQKKLYEKKQQQLNQLREIEEEIKQGKIRPHPLYSPPLFPPSYPPLAKKQPWNGERLVPRRKSGLLPCYYYYHPGFRRMKLRSHTPEVLLVPHYLENSRIYYDYPSCMVSRSIYPQYGRLQNDESSVYGEQEVDDGVNEKITPKNNSRLTIKEPKVSNLTQQQPLSDVESQSSLPRSYTLPREFRYNKKIHTLSTGRLFSPLREHIHEVPSNNSSDGDVDSDFSTVNESENERTSGVPKNAHRNPLSPQRQRAYRHHLRRTRG